MTGTHRWWVLSGFAGAAVGALVTGGVLWGGPPVTAASPAGCGGSSPRLTVTGTGLATGTPDVLTVTLSVRAAGSSAQSAMSADNTETASVVDALAQGGVAKQDVQTTGLSLQPDYTEQHGTTVLTGYSVSNDVVAKLRDIAHAGSTVDAVTSAGGNDVQIQSLGFSIADSRSLEDQARRDAVHQAVAHAATMAAAAGERLGRVCSLSDQSSAPVYGRTPLASPSFGSAAGTVPLEVGTQQETAQVQIVYSLEPGPAGR